MLRRTLRERLFDGETVIGAFQITQSPMIAELLGDAGMDFVLIDQEHGPLTAETTVSLAMGAECGEADTVIRVRSNSEDEIQRALDVGASGVEIPQIETGTDARAAVNAARFDPIGERGLSQYVRAGKYVGGTDYTEVQNEEILVIVHIEGQEGVENIDEIVAVEGIDCVFLGPYDLSQSLGIPGQVRHDHVEALMADVCERAQAHDTVVGTFADNPEMAHQWIDLGVQYIALSVDVPIFHRAVSDLTSQFE